MPLAKGTLLLDRYRIDRLLGAGGMGAVYCHRLDTRLNRGVALKENVLATATSNEQFKREAQTLARLRHPHLPAVHDYFILPQGAQYLVMEYIEGDDSSAACLAPRPAARKPRPGMNGANLRRADLLAQPAAADHPPRY